MAKPKKSALPAHKEPNSETPMSPGQLLKIKFMEPRRLSTLHLAALMGWDHEKLLDVIAGRRNTSMKDAFDIAGVFRASPEPWIPKEADFYISMQRPVCRDKKAWTKAVDSVMKRYGRMFKNLAKK